MKPRVLFLHQWNSSGGLYGSDKVLLDFLQHARRDIDPVVAIESEGIFADAARSLGCEVIVRDMGVLRQKYMTPWGLIHCACHMFRSARWLTRYIRQTNVSLIFTNTVSVLAGGFAAKLSGRPHLWLVHEILEGKARLLAPIVRRWSDRIIVISKASAASVGGGDKMETAYPGVNVAPFKHARPASLGEQDVVIIGMVGRIHHWKGQDYFLDALCELKRRGFGNFRALIVGDVYPGYERLKQYLQRKINRFGLNHVRFCGHQSEIEPVMKALDIVVAPSTRPDPFCLVVAEAMAAARPVISTNWGGPAEIIEDGVSGFLIPPNDPRLFADRLERLIQSPELRRQLGAAGQKRVEESFSREIFNQRVLARALSMVRSA